MKRIIIEYYQNYFTNLNNLAFKKDLIFIVENLSPSFKVDGIMDKFDITAVMQALKSGYNSHAFDADRYINQVDDYKRTQIILTLLPPLKDFYQQNKIQMEVFWETVSDIGLRINLYNTNHGRLGLTPDDGHWLLRIFFLSIFKLGSLQFERLEINKNRIQLPIKWTDYASLQKINDSDVLSVHIMAGSDLSASAVRTSFKAANQFFDCYFPHQNFKVFYCASWFLYPDLKKILDENSRILSFAEKFKIIGQAQYPDHAVYSIFQGNIHKKAITSLEKRAQAYPEYLGVGVGIIPYPYIE